MIAGLDFWEKKMKRLRLLMSRTILFIMDGKVLPNCGVFRLSFSRVMVLQLELGLASRYTGCINSATYLSITQHHKLGLITSEAQNFVLELKDASAETVIARPPT